MRKMMGLLLAAITSSTYAAEWIKAYEDNGVTIMVDNLSIQQSADSVTMWQRFQYKGTPSNPKISGKKVSHTVSRAMYRCADRSSATLSRVVYDSYGNVLQSGNWSIPIFSPVVPDTLGEAVLDVLCQR
ncbi:surface-adhesin E family protein [Pandoraea sputorum]|uniref:surface-adhesin E family protein n=1 Tax=Pandoraea sputorum TaxID=93222 RepID=UPI002F3EFC3F